MAYGDYEDKGGYGQDGSGDPAPPDDFAAQLASLYAQYGHPPPTAEEIQAHRGNPRGLAGVEDMLIQDFQSRQPTQGGVSNSPVTQTQQQNNVMPLGQGLLAPFQGTPPAAPGTGTPYIPQTPNYTAPTFTPPTYKPPPAFNLPSPTEAMNDPGYQFTLGQGQKGLEQSAAARGLLNTGGTAKSLVDYNQAAATTQYGNVLNRMLNQYLTNYETQFRQPYEFAYRSAADQFAPQMAGFQANVGAGNLGYSTQAAAGQRANEFSYDALWKQYLNSQDLFRDQRDSTFNKTFSYLTAE